MSSLTAPMDSDVIAAIATPLGRGAVGIVRLSGAGVLDIFSRIFCKLQPEPAKSNEKLNAKVKHGADSKPRIAWESHRMYYGWIVDAGDTIDEVMACCMLAPRSYTKEDTVEIYAHGGIATLHGVLNAALNNGARLALPGEFTKRAFLNGRINLTQAEAVMDLIGAASGTARRAGLRQLGGGLSQRLVAARDKLLLWLAHIELSIDYPEHEEEAMNRESILLEGQDWLIDMKALHKTAEIGRVLRDGVKTAILGRPNVGKSTLLNAILGEDRAIVHEIPGTTRDVLAEQVQVGDVVLRLMDTAGIRKTDDPIESIGVDKSYEAARDAELILYVMDRSKPLVAEDMDILNVMKDKYVLIVLNKCDMPPAEGWEGFFADLGKISTHMISAQTRDGLDKLYTEIQSKFMQGLLSPEDAETDIVTRERHKLLLQSAIGHVTHAMKEFAQGVAEDLVSIGLREAYIALGEILGMDVSDDIVDRIFSEFCVGK